MKAIDILRASGGEATAVEKAVRMHIECGCQGGGACYLHPEQPCPDCGFNYADSFGVEPIMDRMAESEPELIEVWDRGRKD